MCCGCECTCVSGTVYQQVAGNVGRQCRVVSCRAVPCRAVSCRCRCRCRGGVEAGVESGRWSLCRLCQLANGASSSLFGVRNAEASRHTLAAAAQGAARRAHGQHGPHAVLRPDAPARREMYPKTRASPRWQCSCASAHASLTSDPEPVCFAALCTGAVAGSRFSVSRAPLALHARASSAPARPSAAEAFVGDVHSHDWGAPRPTLRCAAQPSSPRTQAPRPSCRATPSAPSSGRPTRAGPGS